MTPKNSDKPIICGEIFPNTSISCVRPMGHEGLHSDTAEPVAEPQSSAKPPCPKDCSLCSGEYCIRHFDRGCKCDWDQRHTPEEKPGLASSPSIDPKGKVSSMTSLPDEKKQIGCPEHGLNCRAGNRD